MNDEVMYVDEQGNPVNVNTGGGGQSYAPVASRSDKADLLDKIRPDVIVDTIRHKLMGEDFVNNKWVKVSALQDRALTILGAWDIANLMLTVSSQNVALSKLTDLEIRERTLSIARTAQNMLLKNWREYGIYGTDQLEFVHQIIFSNTFITLKQPQDGGIRDLLKGVTSETRQVITQEEKRGGFFFGRGKR